MDSGQAHQYATELASHHNFSAKPQVGVQWWYFTGHLWTGDVCKTDFKTFPAGEPKYGVQATFFFSQEKDRSGMLGHAAESFLNESRFRNTARFDLFKSGDFSSLASKVQAQVLNLKLFDWSLVEIKPSPEGNWFLSFSIKGIGYELLLAPESKNNLWLHGDRGWVKKLGNDSNFYATLPFVKTHGVRTDSKDNTSQQVCGSLWFDREIGVENVNSVQWNWFAARFRNGDAYMFYSLKSGTDTKVFGEVFSKTGRALEDVKVETFDEKCLSSRNCYPQRFKISFRDKGETKVMLVKNDFAEQEHAAEEPFKTYWEGSARVELGKDVGFAYVEMAR